VSKTSFTYLLQDHILADVQSRGEMREEEDWKCPLPTRCKFRMRLFFLTERRRRRASTKIKEKRKWVSLLLLSALDKSSCFQDQDDLRSALC
jgi:hypothetical protein